ncbi:DUF2007 domain-containing protein [Bacteroidota bacterium]
MASNKVLVFTTNNPVEAELIKQHLMNNNIAAFVLNKKDSSYGFGEIEIHVDRDDVIRSKKIIEDYFSNE